MHEVAIKIKSILKNVDFASTSVIVKIGNGVPTYKELILELDETLPVHVNLEIVSEAGSNKPLKENKRSRSLRHISSAIRIAAREGYIYPRRRNIEQNS